MVRPSRRGPDSSTYTRFTWPRLWAILIASRTLSLWLSVTIVAWGGTTLRKVRAIRSRARSNSVRISRRTAFGSCPSETSRAMRCATLWTMAIAGCASETRRATSASSFGSGRPLASTMASPIVSTARRASFEAPLVRSSAIPRIASSTGAGSMLHPLVVRGEAGDAHADPPLEEIPRVSLRRAAAHVVQLAHDAVFADRGELVLDHASPCRIRGHHRLDCGLRFRVRAIVTEEKGSRLQRQESSERLEVLLQVEGRRGSNRHEDFVAGEVQARSVPGVHASVVLVEDRELMGRVAR